MSRGKPRPERVCASALLSLQILLLPLAALTVLLVALIIGGAVAFGSYSRLVLLVTNLVKERRQKWLA